LLLVPASPFIAWGITTGTVAVWSPHPESIVVAYDQYYVVDEWLWYWSLLYYISLLLLVLIVPIQFVRSLIIYVSCPPGRHRLDKSMDSPPGADRSRKYSKCKRGWKDPVLIFMVIFMVSIPLTVITGGVGPYIMSAAQSKKIEDHNTTGNALVYKGPIVYVK